MTLTAAHDLDAFQAGYAAGVEQTRSLFEAMATLLPAIVPADPDRDVSMADLAAGLTRINPRALRVLRPFDRYEAVTPKQAADIAGRSDTTVRAWVDAYAIGRHVGGSVRISHPALLMLLDGDVFALAAYLSGDRGPIVRPYFERAGLINPATPSFAE